MLDFCGMKLEHPVINGSGTFDVLAAKRVFGDAVQEQFPFSAFVSKTITLERRSGNPPKRLWEAASGLVNSIGLPNKGVDAYLQEDLPVLAQLPVPLITNVMGSSVAEFCALIERVADIPQIMALELNVSCPNVKTGLDLGASPSELGGLIEAVRPLTRKPLIMKLTPNTASITKTALAAEAGGADAVSLVNTLRSFAVHPNNSGSVWLGGTTGGLSGAAIRSVALAQVFAVSNSVSLPVVGMGGVSTASHAQDFFNAGATLIAVGTETFRNPLAAREIATELVG